MRTLRFMGLLLLAGTLIAAVSAGASQPEQIAQSLFAGRADLPTFGKALAEYEKLYAAKPPDYEGAMFLARAFFEHGQRAAASKSASSILPYTRCDKWAQQAWEKSPDDYEANFFAKVCQYRAAMIATPDKAKEHVQEYRLTFERMIEKNPDKPLAYRALGRMLGEAPEWPVALRDTKTAETMLAKAHELAPRDVRIAFEYAQALSQNGKTAQARRMLVLLGAYPDEPGWEVESKRIQKQAKALLERLRGK